MTYRVPKGMQYADLSDVDLREVYRHWRGVARYAVRHRSAPAAEARARLTLALQEIVKIEIIAKDRRVYL